MGQTPRYPEIKTRRAKTDDLERIEEIERESFPSPWGRAAYEEELALRGAVLLAAEAGDDMIGFVAARVVMDEGHVIKIAVSGDWRRRGVARRLMDALEKEFRKREVKVIWLEVRSTNRPARMFYRGLDFHEIAVRRKYYADTGEDAVVMMKEME